MASHLVHGVSCQVGSFALWKYLWLKGVSGLVKMAWERRLVLFEGVDVLVKVGFDVRG